MHRIINSDVTFSPTTSVQVQSREQEDRKENHFIKVTLINSTLIRFKSILKKIEFSLLLLKLDLLHASNISSVHFFDVNFVTLGAN